jgi:uncharacterized protein YuzE
MIMRLEYDLNVGALYIRLSDVTVARTREVGDNAHVDLDAAGRVVGLEVLSVARQWPLAEILAAYDIPAGEVAQLRAYFPFSGAHDGPEPPSAAPELRVSSPAPAALLSATA